MTEQIREIIEKHANLPVDVTCLRDDADLWLAGMTSYASVEVTLALEARFDVEFPERMLLPDAFFRSVAEIRSALSELGAKAGV